jgi:hypothetical protein
MPMWVSVMGFVIAPVSALIAVWLTSHFAWRRTQNEKIWDRKANAYGAILEALSEMKAWFDVNMDDEILRREPADEVVEERRTSFATARKALRGVVGREAWLLNPAVGERMDAMNKIIDAHYESWFDKLDASGFEVRKTITDLTALAQTELRTR